LIVIYIVIVIVETDYPNHDDFYYYLDLIFLLIFVTELLLRIAANGVRGFFLLDEADANIQPLDGNASTFDQACKPYQDFRRRLRHMSLFDFFVVFFGCVGLLGSQGKHDHVGVMSVMLRGARVLRALRLVRLLDRSTQLQQLITGLVKISAYLLTLIFLFTFIIFAFAIVTTKLVGRNEDFYPEGCQDDIRNNFGNMGASMKTLFQFMTLDNWRSISSCVSLCDRTAGCTEGHMLQEYAWYFFFVFYIILTNFTILSLLTGVVTEALGRTREENEDNPNSRENREKMDKVRVAALRLFSGNSEHRAPSTDAFKMQMSRSEWSEIFGWRDGERISDPNNRYMVEILNDLDIDPEGMDQDDVDLLFDTFDVEGDGIVTWKQFETAIFRLKGECSAFHAFKMKRVIQELYYQVPRNLAREAASFQNADLSQLQEVIDQLEGYAYTLKRRVNDLEKDVEARYPAMRA
jgi:hypothetical protein